VLACRSAQDIFGKAVSTRVGHMPGEADVSAYAGKELSAIGHPHSPGLSVELAGDEPRVESAHRQQRGARAVLDDSTPRHDQDEVGVHEGAERLVLASCS